MHKIMNLQKLNLVDLNALYQMTEKYMEYTANRVKMNEYSNHTRYNELHRKYNDIVKKYNLILEEVNNRINSIINEKMD